MSVSTQPCGKPLNPFIQRVFRGRFRRKGFALILTLTMMVLLTAIALGFLSLSSIALRSSAHEGDIRLARANAKMALMLAIGELQKQAGPDQRITATADIAGNALGERLADGASPGNSKSINNVEKGLSTVRPGSRYWTGVWTNSVPADKAVTDIYTMTPSPTLVKWLISGNEENSDSGGITPSSNSIAVSSSGEVGRDAVVLVGEYSVGAPSNQTIPNYVSAPLVAIDTEVGGQTRTTGRYGWWVGDEGVKARLNQTSETNPNAVTEYRTLGADRRGWETVQGFDQFPTGSNGQARLGKVVSNSQATLIASALERKSGAVSRVFHSATTDSYGVISDTLAGGLRLDLNAYLASLPAGPVPGQIWSPMAGRNVIPVLPSAANMADIAKLKGPTWDRLKEFNDFYQTNLAGGKLTVTAPANANSYGIAPIIIDLRILLGAKLVNRSTTQFSIFPSGKIAVSLANPYPYPMTWSTPMEFELKSDLASGTQSGYAPSRVYVDGAQGPPYFPKVGNTAEGSVFGNTVFTIPAGEIPAGEAIVYTIAAKADRSIALGSGRLNVPLAPLSLSTAGDFEMSVQVENATLYPELPPKTQQPLVDVREAWNSSAVTAELRLGATKVLRRLDRFELDNGYFGVNRQVVKVADVPSMTKPFALMMYRFEMSQPGGPYDTYFSSSSSSGQMGLRSSTLRTFADFNVQASRFRKAIGSYNPPPYFMESTNTRTDLPYVSGGVGQAFLKNIVVPPLKWGRGLALGSKKTILFSPPESIVSLAQFQHADLTADDLSVSVSTQPGNAAGNSYAPPFVKRNFVSQNRNDLVMNPSSNTVQIDTAVTYYDISYLLNAALWDTYFCSSIPRSGSPVPTNTSITRIDPTVAPSELRDGKTAASHLLIKGAHNVNSTEKDAWKALLASAKFRGHRAEAGASNNDALFARSLEQPSPSSAVPTGDSEDSFAGFRRLTNQQIDAVAEELVRQVRMRGPFLSLSHFVNRGLTPLATNAAIGRSGALQSALDIGANISPDGTRSSFGPLLVTATDKLNLQSLNGSPAADLKGSIGGATNPDWGTVSADTNAGAVASIVADREMLNPTGSKSQYAAEQGFRSTGIPGWLTQADVLQVIGPSLATRSDTFRVRSYGEAVDASGKTTARAWCEAVVQRSPLYIDSSGSGNATTDRGNSLTPMNRIFGRQFDVVSFRWLSPNEI